jgi:hypothetical protein
MSLFTPVGEVLQGCDYTAEKTLRCHLIKHDCCFVEAFKRAQEIPKAANDG